MESFSVQDLQRRGYVNVMETSTVCSAPEGLRARIQLGLQMRGLRLMPIVLHFARLLKHVTLNKESTSFE